jgi:hypothetical protein
MIELYKDGNVMNIVTDAKNEVNFIDEFSELFSDMIQEKAYDNDWQFQLLEWVPQVVDICCKYRGYKSQVFEKKLLIAGDPNLNGEGPRHKIDRVKRSENHNYFKSEHDEKELPVKKFFAHKTDDECWKALTDFQPKLLAIFEAAKKEPKNRKNLGIWMKEYKPQMQDVVGLHCKEKPMDIMNHPMLSQTIIQSSKAYDIAYRKIVSIFEKQK